LEHVSLGPLIMGFLWDERGVIRDKCGAHFCSRPAKDTLES